MFKRTPEHDAFGPWVLPVDQLDQVPPLFRPAVDLTGVRLAVKVPRPIERRLTHPDMDLYDHLILVRDNQIEVHSRDQARPGGQHQQALLASDLLAIENSTDLLDGRLRIHASGGRVLALPYNTVSDEIVTDLVDQMRLFWRPPNTTHSPQPPLEIDALGDKDIGLTNHFRAQARRDSQLQTIILRRRQPAKPDAKTGLLTRALHGLWPVQLHAAIVATTGSELVVVHRRNWLTQKRRPLHSLATTVFPLRTQTEFEITDLPQWSGIQALQLHPTSINFYLAADDGIAAAITDLFQSSPKAPSIPGQ